jgi:hypothetical protein
MLLILGIFGNVISMIIFSRNSMIKYTTFRYLFWLSIVDICVLLTGTGDHLLQVYFKLNIRLVNNTYCKLHSFSVIFFTHISSMILVFMSIDRAIVITIKIAKNYSTVRSANKVFFFLLFFIGVFNFHLILFGEVVQIKDLPNAINSNLSNLTDVVCYSRNPTYFFFLSTVFPW